MRSTGKSLKIILQIIFQNNKIINLQMFKVLVGIGSFQNKTNGKGYFKMSVHLI